MAEFEENEDLLEDEQEGEDSGGGGNRPSGKKERELKDKAGKGAAKSAEKKAAERAVKKGITGPMMGCIGELLVGVLMVVIIIVVIGAVIAIFAKVSGADVSEPGGGPQAQGCEGTSQQLAARIVNELVPAGKVYYHNNNSNVKADLEQAARDGTFSAAGTSDHPSLKVVPANCLVLQSIIELSKNYEVGIWVLSRGHCRYVGCDPSNNESQHFYGNAADYGGWNGISQLTGTDEAREVTLRVMKTINTWIGSGIVPDQAISCGVGANTGSCDPEFDRLSINNCQNSPGLSRNVGDHKDHIHLGYGQDCS